MAEKTTWSAEFWPRKYNGHWLMKAWFGPVPWWRRLLMRLVVDARWEKNPTDAPTGDGMFCCGDCGSYSWNIAILPDAGGYEMRCAQCERQRPFPKGNDEEA